MNSNGVTCSNVYDKLLVSFIMDIRTLALTEYNTFSNHDTYINIYLIECKYVCLSGNPQLDTPLSRLSLGKGQLDK